MNKFVLSIVSIIVMLSITGSAAFAAPAKHTVGPKETAYKIVYCDNGSIAKEYTKATKLTVPQIEKIKKTSSICKTATNMFKDFQGKNMTVTIKCADGSKLEYLKKYIPKGVTLKSLCGKYYNSTMDAWIPLNNDMIIRK
jgi:hypothetical protein